MTDPHPNRAAHRRIATLVNEIVFARQRTLSTIGVSKSSLSRIMSGQTDYLLTTLVEVLDALGYDVVINVREKRS